MEAGALGLMGRSPPKNNVKQARKKRNRPPNIKATYSVPLLFEVRDTLQTFVSIYRPMENQAFAALSREAMWTALQGSPNMKASTPICSSEAHQHPWYGLVGLPWSSNVLRAVS